MNTNNAHRIMGILNAIFKSSDNYRGNVTSEGYPRGAKDVADWLRREGVGYKEMTLDEFKSSEYYNQRGVIYQVA